MVSKTKINTVQKLDLCIRWTALAVPDFARISNYYYQALYRAVEYHATNGQRSQIAQIYKSRKLQSRVYNGKKGWEQTIGEKSDGKTVIEAGMSGPSQLSLLHGQLELGFNFCA